jgi:hypothetical protein
LSWGRRALPCLLRISPRCAAEAYGRTRGCFAADIVDAETHMMPALKVAIEAFDKFRKAKPKAKSAKEREELKALQTLGRRSLP